MSNAKAAIIVDLYCNTTVPFFSGWDFKKATPGLLLSDSRIIILLLYLMQNNKDFMGSKSLFFVFAYIDYFQNK